jgi:hypothetical protein
VQHVARLHAVLDQHSQALTHLRAELARLHTPAASATPVVRKRPPRKG